MIRGFSFVAAVLVGATAVYAQSTAISERQEAMKAIASAAKEPGAVMKGESEFDLAKVQNSLAVYEEQANRLKDLWPENSMSGDTSALPAVWEKRDDFLGRFAKMAADAKAAAERSRTKQASRPSGRK